VSDEGLGDEENALEVYVEDGVIIGFSGVPEIGAAFEASVVDENVDLAELSDGVSDELLALPNIANIALECGAFAAELLDGGDDFVGARSVGAVAKGDVGSLGGEFLRDGQANALAGSGDGGDFRLQAVRHDECPFFAVVQSDT
jgi:hypothetical protein